MKTKEEFKKKLTISIFKLLSRTTETHPALSRKGRGKPVVWGLQIVRIKTDTEMVNLLLSL